MAYSSFPFDGQSTSEAQYRKLFKQIQGNGVITPAASLPGLKVTAGGGMTLTLAAGDAAVEGFYFTSDSAVTLTVQASSTVARTDLVVLRLDLDGNAITPMVLRGNTSSGAAPALNLTATGNLFDLLLATITVPANAGSIVSGNIADSRSYASNPVGVWTTATRPSDPRLGQSGFNSTLGYVEAWNGSTWTASSGGAVDTGWVTCTNASASVTGTVKVRRIGNQVFGQLSLSYSGGWPTSGAVTAFVLPDASFSAGVTHRMSVGGAVQGTAQNILLSNSPGNTSVFIGANGSAGTQVTYSGALWLVD